MKKFLYVLIGLFFICTTSTLADQEVIVEKQLIGIVGAASGEIKTPTRILKTGDKVYLNETIFAGPDSGTQILLLDQSTFTIGSDSEVVMDTFIYDSMSLVICMCNETRCLFNIQFFCYEGKRHWLNIPFLNNTF